ncbi:MAG TPA: hypothetical protein DEO32_06625 [Ruminococcaceae bacterium]|nr:hypothetical protein [Oscillospiraceae bacterium]
MTKENFSKLTDHVKSYKIHVGFALSCFLTVAAFASLYIRGFNGMKPQWMFSIGADVFCSAVCVMLCFSCFLNRRNATEETNSFVTMISTTALALFLDEASWLVQGLAQFRYLNIAINVLHYMNGVVLIFLFWQYISRALRIESRMLTSADRLLNLLSIPALLLCVVNNFYPLYFSVDANGVYQRSENWVVSQFYLVAAVLTMCVGLAYSKASLKDRLVATSFAAIPLLNMFLTGMTFGISTQYASILVSIVLIYGVVFAEREKSITLTENELSVATRIQADMLPNTFPFMPERNDFDLYASMTPAKEVGGDFYDFFMVDENRIALTIADVSGKGIPAALFMMASKILIKNCVMTGKSPGDVLSIVNNQICENNREEMFVTVWLGILDLTNGRLVSANAGHEYPAIKSPDGDFEIIKTKHSFVIGGMPGLKYKESETVLLPGSKLFVYTDGVPEAEAGNGRQYGCDRFLETLNNNKDKSPRELLAAVQDDISDFAQNTPQFDDLTMLCVHYIGSEVKSSETADN